MDTRREFLKKAMLLSGVAGWNGMVPESIRKAMAINPAPGSTFLDAEHVVILMQENRSFDHCFGSLKGVRGFNDPRYIRLPDGNPVWLQTNAAGRTYAPFRFDIRDTKITWMGSIPHSRSSQIDACNRGKYDQWLDAKRSSNRDYADMPLTLGHYTREDLPFNYALADAFTVCDQNFSSAMTSTWPNRLFLWSGTVRGEQSINAKAYIRNDIPYGEAHWKTFPELLEENGVSWKVYQNDITAGGGFSGEERAWLSNFGCNQLENFSQYNVRFSPRYVKSLQDQAALLPGEIESLKAKLASADGGSAAEKIRKQIAAKEEVLEKAKAGLAKWSRENFDQLNPESKNLFRKAFTNNAGDPDYHQLIDLSYEEHGEKRELKIPKGDILHQFREDVHSGKLPAVSWLVGPEKFSDHPTSPWYGAWYVSEVLDILTKDPEVWKKTIFILTYDENDGYFDHIPPYVAPDPLNPESGKCSAGIDPSVEYIRLEQELQQGLPSKEAREGPTGLGFRVPMIIASPWSRGGRVCSQVFDHTSVFRFVQEFLNRKTGKQVKESTISAWRKTVSGNLTSAFRPWLPADQEKLPFLQKVPFIESIFNARFREAPSNFKALTAEEIADIGRDPASSSLMPKQEPGIKAACALPYQLYADGNLNAGKTHFEIRMEARNEIFGERSAGSPFNIYIPTQYAATDPQGKTGPFEYSGVRSYAVAAGGLLAESWPLKSFENGIYHLRLYGPNGFYREYRGDEKDPDLTVRCGYERSPLNNRKLTGQWQIIVKNNDVRRDCRLEIRDLAYKMKPVTRLIPAGATEKITLDQGKSFGWYDYGIYAKGHDRFEKRYAGRIETGQDGFSDPRMGGII